VIIRKDTLSEKSASYGIITIPSISSLIFDDTPTILRTNGIDVQGSLLLGSLTCRLQATITTTLLGVASETMLSQSAVVKGILVTGTLEAHSMVYSPTWTRLAATASAGSTMIYLQDLVNWTPKQLIVIMTTALKDTLDYSESEQRWIINVWRAPHLGADITVVKFDTPLKYSHYEIIVCLLAGSEYRAVVALISRNIVIKSAVFDSIPPAETLKTVCSDSTYGTYPCHSGNVLY
jgi:G8 domain